MNGIKIQLGEVQLNKTKRFILPCLKLYGNEFISKINSVFKLAYGIGDMYISQRYEKHIFILIDSQKCTTFFIPFLEWIREQEYYEDDYEADSMHEGRLHMIVIKIPDVVDLSQFLSGKYSKMYTKDEIVNLLKDDEKSIVIKDSNYKIKFVKKLNKVFNTNLKESEISSTTELELPPNFEQKEYFSSLL